MAFSQQHLSPVGAQAKIIEGGKMVHTVEVSVLVIPADSLYLMLTTGLLAELDYKRSTLKVSIVPYVDALFWHKAAICGTLKVSCAWEAYNFHQKVFRALADGCNAHMHKSKVQPSSQTEDDREHKDVVQGSNSGTAWGPLADVESSTPLFFDGEARLLQPRQHSKARAKLPSLNRVSTRSSTQSWQANLAQAWKGDGELAARRGAHGIGGDLNLGTASHQDGGQSSRAIADDRHTGMPGLPEGPELSEQASLATVDYHGPGDALDSPQGGKQKQVAYATLESTPQQQNGSLEPNSLWDTQDMDGVAQDIPHAEEQSELRTSRPTSLGRGHREMHVSHIGDEEDATQQQYTLYNQTKLLKGLRPRY